MAGVRNENMYHLLVWDLLPSPFALVHYGDETGSLEQLGSLLEVVI